MDIGKREIEAMRIVKDDLLYIRQSWGENIDDNHLRRDSAILRQLLVDNGGLLLRIQEWLGLKIFVNGPPDPLKLYSLSIIRLYIAGGATYQGMSVHSVYELNRALSADEIKLSYLLTKNPNSVKYSLENYLSAPSVIVNGQVFNRINLVKYIANKLGGAHYELDEHNLGRMKLLETVKNQFVVANKNAAYFEFLSIGQMLTNSDYIIEVERKINKYC